MLRKIFVNTFYRPYSQFYPVHQCPSPSLSNLPLIRTKTTKPSSSSNNDNNFIRKNLTNEISFITNAPGVTELKLKNQENRVALDYSSNGRPLSVLLFWLMAVDKTMNKYIKIYLDAGFDVLTVRITPWQLTWPKTIFHVSDNDLIGFLESTDHQKKFVHGFSVGGYVFTRMLIYAYRNPGRYQKVLDSFCGHIWENIVDVSGGPYGISKTVFPNSDLLQKTLQKMIEFHFIIMRPWATKYYDESHEYFYNRHLTCPGLFLGSERDLISTPEIISAMREAWAKRGVPSRAKIWKDTKHVGSLQKHPEEYMAILEDFWQSVGLKATIRPIGANNTIDEENIPKKRALGGEKGW